MRPYPANSFPRLGTCYSTRIKVRGPRLATGDPWVFKDSNPDSSGSSVLFENGLAQVSYDAERAILHSRPSDRVRMCVASLPRHCPAGDHRGVVYRTRNLRTGETWRLPDSQHECGGA